MGFRILMAFIFSFLTLHAKTYNVCEVERLDVQSAKIAIEDILLREPTNTQCMLQLSNVYLKQGKISKGFEILVDAYSMDPHNVQKSPIASVLPFALKVTNLKKQAYESNDKELWNKLGDGYFEMGIFNEAVLMFKNSLLADQTQDEIRLKLALSLYRNCQTYSAMEELKKILSRHKDHFYAAYYLGKILAYDVQSSEEAKEYFVMARDILNQKKDILDASEYDMLLCDVVKELKE